MFRSGDWETTIAALEQTIELQVVGTSYEWFFIAMAHWQLGHKSEAQTWFNESVQWMIQNKPNDSELIRFHAEAAELLGISVPIVAPEPEQRISPDRGGSQ